MIEAKQTIRPARLTQQSRRDFVGATLQNESISLTVAPPLDRDWLGRRPMQIRRTSSSLGFLQFSTALLTSGTRDTFAVPMRIDLRRHQHSSRRPRHRNGTGGESSLPRR